MSGKPRTHQQLEGALQFTEPELSKDLEETIQLKAIMSVSAPDVLTYTAAVTKGVGLPRDGVPEPVWVAPSYVTRSVDRTGTVQALWEGLHLDATCGPRPRSLADAEDRIVEAIARGPRLVIVLGAHELRTEPLEMLYSMWAHLVPGGFPLILTGQSGKLEEVLSRPALASLKSCIYLRRQITPDQSTCSR